MVGDTVDVVRGWVWAVREDTTRLNVHIWAILSLDSILAVADIDNVVDSGTVL